MSNFVAPTRRKGSDDKFKEAVWIDNYFKDAATREARYGVRFRGTVDFLHGDEYEIGEVKAE